MFEFVVGDQDLGARVDVFIAQQIDGLSRSKAGELVRAGHVLVNGAKPKASIRLKTGDLVTAEVVELKPELPIAEDIPLNIIYEDDTFVAINKPPAMVVHPAKGHWKGTLTAALMHHFNSLSKVGGPQRPGIVHRLDRDTSGVILIAKNDQAHMALTGQFENRTVKKTYLAIVSPPPDRDRDEIDAPIGIHPYQREKMAVRSGHKTSREAQTFYEVQSTVGRFAIVHAFPKTGRTHQIRVHLAHVGSPVLCDRLYSGRAEITSDMINSSADKQGDVILARQALHALSIEFNHPLTKEAMKLEAVVPEDIAGVMSLLVK